MTKDEVRKVIKNYRTCMSEAEVNVRSKHIMLNIMNLTEFDNADTILTYVNYGQEVVTKDLITYSLNKGKTVLVPKVYGKEMHFHQIKSLSELKKGAFGIPEPDNECIMDPRQGLMIMPGLAYDAHFNRVGYGGGFYDRYLEDRSGLLKVAVGYHYQMLDHDLIETNQFDMKPDMIVTEDRIYRNEG